ncbi:hypothetical protein AALD22_17490 [Lachnospiraceae bacterium 56-18]
MSAVLPNNVHGVEETEDDTKLREGLSFSFSGDGYDVTETGTKIIELP